MPSKNAAAADGATGRYSGFRRRGTGEGLRFSQVQGDLLPRAVDSILSVGDACLLARTSDGGALVIRPIHEGTSDPIYCADMSELREALEGLAELPT